MRDSIGLTSIAVRLCVCICIVMLLGNVPIGASTKEVDSQMTQEEQPYELPIEYEDEKSESTLEQELNPDAVTRPQKQNKTIIAIDAGHGGDDSGCIYGEYKEKDINLNVALMLEGILLSKGYEVHMTRKDDSQVDTYSRAQDVNASRASLLVSIHHNAFDDQSLSGIETWYNKNSNGDNYRFARAIQSRVIKFTDSLDRGLFLDEELIITRDVTIPSCLIEAGYMSNSAELSELVDAERQEKVASAIAQGIEDFFNPKILYLTFDDGPSDKTTATVLDILRDNNVKATFFVIGESVRANPELARRIVDEGHAVGIHCDNHSYSKLYASKESFIMDFENAYKSVVEIMGVEPKMFRFPGGSINSFNKKVYKDIVDEMSSKGFIYFDWNVSIDDAVKNTTVEMLLKNAERGISNKGRVILLAHDTSSLTAEILEELLHILGDYKTEVLTEDVAPMRFRG